MVDFPLGKQKYRLNQTTMRWLILETNKQITTGPRWPQVEADLTEWIGMLRKQSN